MRTPNFDFHPLNITFFCSASDGLGNVSGETKIDGVSVGESRVSLTKEETQVLRDIMQMAARRKKMMLKKKYQDEVRAKTTTPESSPTTK